MELILKFLKIAGAKGAYLEDIVRDANLPRLRCTEYLNALMRAGELIRESRKGLLYKLNPQLY